MSKKFNFPLKNNSKFENKDAPEAGRSPSQTLATQQPSKETMGPLTIHVQGTPQADGMETFSTVSQSVGTITSFHGSINSMNSMASTGASASYKAATHLLGSEHLLRRLDDIVGFADEKEGQAKGWVGDDAGPRKLQSLIEADTPGRYEKIHPLSNTLREIRSEQEEGSNRSDLSGDRAIDQVDKKKKTLESLRGTMLALKGLQKWEETAAHKSATEFYKGYFDDDKELLDTLIKNRKDLTSQLPLPMELMMKREASRVLEKLAKAYSRSLGRRNPLTVKTKERLAECREFLRHHE